MILEALYLDLEDLKQTETERDRDRQIETHTEADRQGDGQTDGRTDGQTDRQTERDRNRERQREKATSWKSWRTHWRTHGTYRSHKSSATHFCQRCVSVYLCDETQLFVLPNSWQTFPSSSMQASIHAW